jgi:hypothetical protein
LAAHNRGVTAPNLLPLDTDKFIVHFEKTPGEVPKRKTDNLTKEARSQA